MSAADLLERLRALLFRRKRAAELEEEMRLHLELEGIERMRQGADPDAARRDARLAFGGLERYKEEVRDASGVRPLQDIAGDLRFAARALRRNPGFTASVIVVLGLAIGASTAVFSVVDAVLLSELPFPHADRLVMVFEQSPVNRWNMSAADYIGVREQQHSFDAFGAMQSVAVSMAGTGLPEQVRIGRGTAGFFDALGARAVAGRLIGPADETLGAPAVAVVTHALARNRLGGDSAAIGRTLTFDGVSHTVVGVLPNGGDQLIGRDIVAWAALQLKPPTRRGPFPLRGIGRLKEGVTVEAAQRDLAQVSQRLLQTWNADFHDTTAKLTPHPLRQVIVGNADTPLRLFALAVALVLLVATLNVATLVLVRSSAREPEFAVRTALGASRPRIARLLLTENLLLTMVSAAIGLALAGLGLRLVGSVAPNLPRAHEIGLGTHALLFAAAIAIVSGLLMSVSPALGVLGGHATNARGDAGRSIGGRRGQAIRGALVAAEFALALPLLVGAGLLLNSFLRLQRVNPGYDPASTFSVAFALPAARYDYPAVFGFQARAIQAAAESPGVVAAGLGTGAPPDNPGDQDNFSLSDHPTPPGQSEPTSPFTGVTEGYFRALGIPLIEGRLFGPVDSANGPPTVIVSHAWAAKYFPGENAVGRTLVQGGCSACPRTTIVGIVGDVKYQGLAGDGEGVYNPIEQTGARRLLLFVRTTAAPSALMGPVIDRLKALDPELPLAGLTMTDQLKASLGDPERWTAVLASFAAAALLLATLGIFGLMSYVVRRQRREIGVRLALGAEPSDVTRMIVARGMRYAAAGTVVGVGLALLEARWLQSLLFEVTARDPGTLAIVVVLLLIAALVACAVPGLRAGRIRPLEAIATD